MIRSSTLRSSLHCALAVSLLATPAFALAQATQPVATQPAGDAEAEKDAAITIAVLGVETTNEDAEQADLIGRMVSETIEVILSGEDQFRLVNRSDLASTLEEQGVSLTGLIDPNEAVKVGKVIGARLLVTGKAFELGESRMVTAKVIGSETTRVKSVMARGPLDAPLDALVFEVAEKLAEVIREDGQSLVASSVEVDPIPGLIAKLKGKQLPVIAIVIPEEHRRSALAGSPPDPAVETEMKKHLIDAGVDVRDLEDNQLADWVKQYQQGDKPAWPRTLEGVDFVIVGEAFSESAGRLGNLQLASARAEINCISRVDGRIVHADRTTTRGVDLAEEIAGKNALQKAGRIFSQHLLEKLVESTADAE